MHAHMYLHTHTKYMYKIPKVNMMFRLDGDIVEALQIKSRSN